MSDQPEKPKDNNGLLDKPRDIRFVPLPQGQKNPLFTVHRDVDRIVVVDKPKRDP